MPKMAEQIISQNLEYEHRQNPSDCVSFDDDYSIYDTFPPTKPPTSITEASSLRKFQVANTLVDQQYGFPSDPPLLEFNFEIPRGMSVTPSNIRHIVEYVISQFDRLRNIAYFKPQGDPIEETRRVAVWRLSTCAFSRGGMLIDAKIRDSVLEGNDYGYSSEFARWTEGFEQAVRMRLDQPIGPEELRERLIDSLEIFFAKSVVLSTTVTYQLFCEFAPRFLQIVGIIPTLCSAQYDHKISIAHLLASPLYKCVNYVFMDIMGSMVYGLPHILEYTTDIDLFHTRLHPVEWVSCLPGEFLVVLAKLNVFRDHRVCDWPAIEQQLISWEPRPGLEPKGLESWKSIAWFALQEMWRHVLLIYLYLAICGARTDDPRIQASLRQVLQLMRTIKRQYPPVKNAHLFVPYLVTGICSRTERQRKMVRERLGCRLETRLWLFRTLDFVPVLDHLWMGTGLEGHAVTWNDYVHSRQVMLPLYS